MERFYYEDCQGRQYDSLTEYFCSQGEIRNKIPLQFAASCLLGKYDIEVDYTYKSKTKWINKNDVLSWFDTYDWGSLSTNEEGFN